MLGENHIQKKALKCDARKNDTVGIRIKRKKENSNVHGELYWL
jgi:hypothetical protein